MTPRRSDASERILREAMRLFAEKGYERTSVADIQSAAGLTPGSGALYKHFPSKEAVLSAGIDAFIDEAARQRQLLAHLPDRPADAFREMATAVLSTLGREEDVLRIVWRELEHFPELQERVRDRRIQATFAELAEWLRDRTRSGALREHDSDAMSAVILGSLAFYRLLDALMGETPGRLDESRFLQASVDLVTSGLSRQPATDPPDAGT